MFSLADTEDVVVPIERQSDLIRALKLEGETQFSHRWACGRWKSTPHMYVARVR